MGNQLCVVYLKKTGDILKRTTKTYPNDQQGSEDQQVQAAFVSN